MSPLRVFKPVFSKINRLSHSSEHKSLSKLGDYIIRSKELKRCFDIKPVLDYNSLYRSIYIFCHDHKTLL